MISDVYQTTLSAWALSEPGSDPGEYGHWIYSGAMVFLPPHANFSAQISLCYHDFAILPGREVPQGFVSALIFRYMTFTENGDITTTWLVEDEVRFVNNIQNGYAIQFGLKVLAESALVEAIAIATVFIES